MFLIPSDHSSDPQEVSAISLHHRQRPHHTDDFQFCCPAPPQRRSSLQTAICSPAPVTQISNQTQTLPNSQTHRESPIPPPSSHITTININNPATPRPQPFATTKTEKKPCCHQPRSLIFAFSRDGDPPPSVPASHHDYHYTHSQAPVAATHHEHLPSLPCAAMTFTCSLPFHRKYPIDPISKVTQYSPLCVIHFV